jgi:hypothetical protein
MNRWWKEGRTIPISLSKIGNDAAKSALSALSSAASVTKIITGTVNMALLGSIAT